MTRIPNIRPTNIYWLFDTQIGEPFYCGKTVANPKTRLSSHISEASRFFAKPASCPMRPVLARLLEIGRDRVRIEVMETVSADKSWAERETHWISVLRWLNPQCTNVAEGGAGSPGYVPTAATRLKRSIAGRKHRHTDEARARMRIAAKERMTPDECQRVSAKLMGRKFSAETLARMSAGQKARFVKTPMVISPETRAKMSANARGFSESARAAHKAYRDAVSPETRAKMSASAKMRGVEGLTRYRAKTAAAPD